MQLHLPCACNVCLFLNSTLARGWQQAAGSFTKCPYFSLRTCPQKFVITGVDTSENKHILLNNNMKHNTIIQRKQWYTNWGDTSILDYRPQYNVQNVLEIFV